MRYLFLLPMLLLAWGCEPCYDPVADGDVPTSPASTWDNQPIIVKKTVENPFTAEDLSKTMSLSFLLDMALYNNPSTRASWNAARASAYAWRSTLSEYYPSIDYTGTLNAQTNKGSSFATSGGGIISTPGATTTTTAAETRSTNMTNVLSASYLVLDFGGRDANTELALQALYASNWQHNFTMQQVMLSVLNAYISYIENKGLVVAYTQDLKDAEVALKATQVMHQAGLSTLSDVLLIQSTLEQYRTNLIQAQGAEKIAIGDLLIAAGLAPDAEISIEDLPDALPVIEISGDISQLLETAKRNRPDLGIAIAAIKQQEAQLAISYSNSMPILTAGGVWDQVRFISPRKPPGYNDTASLRLTFPIFQGFYYMNQQRQLRAQIEEALANLDVTLATVYTQVVMSYYTFTSAEAALPSAEATVEYSQRAFRGFVIQYRTGTASILDVLNALTILSNARSQVIVTRAQWAGGLANLAYSVGILQDNSGQWKKTPPEKLYKLPIRDDNATPN